MPLVDATLLLKRQLPEHRALFGTPEPLRAFATLVFQLTYIDVSHRKPAVQTNREIRGGPVQKPLRVVVVALISLCTVGLAGQTKQADPWVGTWKTDVAKSTFSPGPKPTVGATVTIERSASGMKTTIEGADPQGKPTRTETAWTFDGKDHPVKGAPTANTHQPTSVSTITHSK